MNNRAIIIKHDDPTGIDWIIVRSRMNTEVKTHVLDLYLAVLKGEVPPQAVLQEKLLTVIQGIDFLIFDIQVASIRKALDKSIKT